MKLAFIHFQPVEKYPPAINLLEHLDSIELETKVWTTNLNATYNSFSLKRINVTNLPGIKKEEHKIIRLLKYLYFNIVTLIYLIRYKPDKIFYFETISGLPGLMYKFLYSKKVDLLVHYHEYTSPEEYKTGMFLSRFIHSLEKKRIFDYSWISHTNEVRAEMFKMDLGNPKLEVKTLPNYPPRKWKLYKKIKNPVNVTQIRLVYVGAICTETMYTRELCEWVENQEGKAMLDIWSHNISANAEVFFNANTFQWINMRGGVDYDRLPKVLSGYDIGVILYKGHIPNYVHNAPNKLFEYLVCGLDVWFPAELKGTYPYIWENSRPRVIKVNFNTLNLLNLQEVEKGVVEQERRGINFVAEEIYSRIIPFLS